MLWNHWLWCHLGLPCSELIKSNSGHDCGTQQGSHSQRQCGRLLPPGPDGSLFQRPKFATKSFRYHLGSRAVSGDLDQQCSNFGSILSAESVEENVVHLSSGSHRIPCWASSVVQTRLWVGGGGGGITPARPTPSERRSNQRERGRKRREKEREKEWKKERKKEGKEKRRKERKEGKQGKEQAQGGEDKKPGKKGKERKTKKEKETKPFQDCKNLTVHSSQCKVTKTQQSFFKQRHLTTQEPFWKTTSALDTAR